MERYRYKIEEIQLKNKKEFKPGRINIFVGANNCGKTQLLEEIFAFITGKSVSHILTRRIDIPLPKTWNALRDSYEYRVINVSGGKALSCVAPTFNRPPVVNNFNHDMESTLNDYLRNRHDDVQLRQWIGPNLITYLNTEERLKLANRQKSHGISQGPNNLLELLYVTDERDFDKINHFTQDIFQKKVLLSPFNPGMLELKINDDFANMETERPQKAYKLLKAVPVLDKQGDGVRSAIGIIAALVCSEKKPIILLDEPEAFLHPPQVLQIGAILGKLVQPSQQIFIATHSADFLRGLFSNEQDIIDDLKIVHIERDSNDAITFNVLETETLNKIITDPLLSSSRVLEGLFYKGVVATEADADAVFYQRAFQKIGLGDEIHFINAHNKQTLKKVIEPYQKLGIRFAMIADADVLRDEHDFKEILQIAQDTKLKERILELRRKIVSHFEKQSNYDLLIGLRKNIKLLTERELISKDSSDETIASELFEIRKELKKYRDDAEKFAKLKKEGKKSLPEALQANFDEIWRLCASVGLFIVYVGELESWLLDYDINRKSSKKNWITEALTELCDMEINDDKELWKFINELKVYFSK